MKHLTLQLLFVLVINLSAQMEKFPFLEPINNTIPESFIIEGDTNELIMFWIDSTDLHISKSLDDGANWNTPTTLVDNESILDSLSDLNALKLNSGRILVTYKFKFHYVIYSDDNGLIWSEPQQLVTDIGSIRPRQVMESSLSQTNDNKIWFVYNRLTRIFNIKSDDGITWSEVDTIAVFDDLAPHNSSVNSHWNNSLVLIYYQGAGQLIQSTSNDSGLTWDEGVVVFDDEITKIRPRVAKNSNGTLWLTWTGIDYTTPLNQVNIYYSKLADGNNSWGTINKFTKYVGFDGIQNLSFVNEKSYITFTSDREEKYALWYGIAGETDDNDTPPVIYMTNINYQNDYPNVNLNITAVVYASDQIDSVLFNYQESRGEIKTIELFDDGMHEDGENGDNIFGNVLTGLKFDFKFDVFYSAVDIVGNKTITGTSSIESPFSEDGSDIFVFDNNNLWMPIHYSGRIADAKSSWENRSGGFFDGQRAIYAGGFALSGYTNGTLWSNGVMSASRVEDYIPGPIESSDAITQFYVVRSSQPDFYQSWIDWKDAVKLGADFYDGDGDGIYNPVDLNGNGTWDGNEDKPDLMGDITAYAVINDGLESQSRTYNNVEPQGIEVKQTVFTYDKVTSPKLSNVIFVRYKIENIGTVAEKLDSVYFAAWADMDIGEYVDDIAGMDTILNSSYTYNDGTDAAYGDNPPACFISLLQGPPLYVDGETYIDVNGNGIYDDGIDTSLDSAKNRKGETLGIDKYPGAKNNKLIASINYMKSHPTFGDARDEYQLRKYLLGYNPDGELIDPCNWEAGIVYNDDCASINPKFMYSGDPVTQNGWVSTYVNDIRQMGSTGPFDLVKGEQIEIIVAYIVGRGTDNLNSITEARRITNDVIGFYNTNFSYVPVGVKENTSSQLPTEYSLSQNYPNPFNPSTTIKYSIPNVESGHAPTVQLKVYDILGREVAALVNKQQKAGSYEIQFDASNLTSGVYFYRLQSGLFNESRKMILLK